jgi:hypothetical protein
MESEMRFFLESISRIKVLTSWPTETTSLGFEMRFPETNCEMWISPSIPGSISTKAPKFWIETTLPVMMLPDR